MQSVEPVNSEWDVVFCPPIHFLALFTWRNKILQKRACFVFHVLYADKFALKGTVLRWRSFNRSIGYQSRACRFFYPPQSDPLSLHMKSKVIWIPFKGTIGEPGSWWCCVTRRCVNIIKTITGLRWRQSSHIHETDGRPSRNTNARWRL